MTLSRPFCRSNLINFGHPLVNLCHTRSWFYSLNNRKHSSYQKRSGWRSLKTSRSSFIWLRKQALSKRNKDECFFSLTAVNVVWVLMLSLLVYCNALLYVWDIVHVCSIVSWVINKKSLPCWALYKTELLLIIIIFFKEPNKRNIWRDMPGKHLENQACRFTKVVQNAGFTCLQNIALKFHTKWEHSYI